MSVVVCSSSRSSSGGSSSSTSRGKGSKKIEDTYIVKREREKWDITASDKSSAYTTLRPCIFFYFG